MSEIEKLLAVSPEELENMSWYEITTALGLDSFNSQGNKPMELISTIAGITGSSNVLVVGCGTGGTAVHLAEITGARVNGIDISEESIRAANAIASKSQAREKLSFQIGDASALPFAPSSFDVVITEYMAFFLKPEAFKGFFETLRSGGYIVMAEPMKDPAVNVKADKKILAAEEVYSDLVGYRLHVPLTTEYVEWLTRAGFGDVRIHEKFSEQRLSEKIRRVGGLRNLLRITAVMMRLMRESPVLRKKMLQAGRFKRVFIQNRSTAQFISQTLVTGRKS